MIKKKRKDSNNVIDFINKSKNEKKISNSESVLKHEEDAAELVGGQRHIGSGSRHGHKSDASSDDLQIECKQTQNDSIVLKVDWLKKISFEAFGKAKIPMMHFRFLNIDDFKVPRDWVMLPAKDFERYVRRIDREDSLQEE